MKNIKITNKLKQLLSAGLVLVTLSNPMVANASWETDCAITNSEIGISDDIEINYTEESRFDFDGYNYDFMTLSEAISASYNYNGYIPTKLVSNERTINYRLYYSNGNTEIFRGDVNNGTEGDRSYFGYIRELTEENDVKKIDVIYTNNYEFETIRSDSYDLNDVNTEMSAMIEAIELDEENPRMYIEEIDSSSIDEYIPSNVPVYRRNFNSYIIGDYSLTGTYTFEEAIRSAYNNGNIIPKEEPTSYKRRTALVRLNTGNVESYDLSDYSSSEYDQFISLCNSGSVEKVLVLDGYLYSFKAKYADRENIEDIVTQYKDLGPISVPKTRPIESENVEISSNEIYYDEATNQELGLDDSVNVSVRRKKFYRFYDMNTGKTDDYVEYTGGNLEEILRTAYEEKSIVPAQLNSESVYTLFNVQYESAGDVYSTTKPDLESVHVLGQSCKIISVEIVSEEKYYIASDIITRTVDFEELASSLKTQLDFIDRNRVDDTVLIPLDEESISNDNGRLYQRYSYTFDFGGAIYRNSSLSYEDTAKEFFQNYGGVMSSEPREFIDRHVLIKENGREGFTAKYFVSDEDYSNLLFMLENGEISRMMVTYDYYYACDTVASSTFEFNKDYSNIIKPLPSIEEVSVEEPKESEMPELPSFLDIAEPKVEEEPKVDEDLYAIRVKLLDDIYYNINNIGAYIDADEKLDINFISNYIEFSFSESDRVAISFFAQLVVDYFNAINNGNIEEAKNRIGYFAFVYDAIMNKGYQSGEYNYKGKNCVISADKINDQGKFLIGQLFLNTVQLYYENDYYSYRDLEQNIIQTIKFNYTFCTGKELSDERLILNPVPELDDSMYYDRIYYDGAVNFDEGNSICMYLDEIVRAFVDDEYNQITVENAYSAMDKQYRK